ncbi:MAG: hypothetical protein WA981_16460 [Glaciecola sp.]
MKNSDLPAMPLSGDAYQDFAHYDGTPKTSYNPECQGLTKREMFAMHAMQGLLANSYGDSWSPEQRVLSISRQSVEHADALLKELEK